MTEREQIPRDGEEYSLGYSKGTVASFGVRTVGMDAAFFTAYLHSGMTLLDCGCGPGTITMGLAEFVDPGKVVGIDINRYQFEDACKAATSRGIENAAFVTSNVYDMPFPDESFDAVLAHALFQHLKHPEAALKEMYRVLRPGGLVALRDDDGGSIILAPELPEMDRVLEVVHSVMRLSGGDPMIGRRYGWLLRTGGFQVLDLSTTTECDVTLEATTRRGVEAGAILEHMSEKAVASGLAIEEEFPILIQASRKWGCHPDALFSIIWCEAVGRKMT